MRAMRIEALGQPLAAVEVPPPVPGPGEVLLRVHACGLNFADTLMAAGRYQVKPPLPFAPGIEVCGTVEALGPGVTGRARRRGSRPSSATAGSPSWQSRRPRAASRPRTACPTPRSRASWSPTAPATWRSPGAPACGPARRCWCSAPSGGVGLTAVEIGALMGARVIAVARGRGASWPLAPRRRGGAPHRQRRRHPRRGEGAGRRRRRLRPGRRRGSSRRRCGALRTGGAAAADRLCQRRGAAVPGEPRAGQGPDRARAALGRLCRRATRGLPRQCRGALRLARPRPAAPARRPRAAARRRPRRGWSCCAAGGPPARWWSRSRRRAIRRRASRRRRRPGGRAPPAGRPARRAGRRPRTC